MSRVDIRRVIREPHNFRMNNHSIKSVRTLELIVKFLTVVRDSNALRYRIRGVSGIIIDC